MKKKSKKWFKREADKLWSKAIHRLFKETCHICGKRSSWNAKQASLNAHHIFSKQAHPAVRYDINNGVLLCFLCHRRIHDGDPCLIPQAVRHLDTVQFESLRTKAKSGSCKHDYEAVIKELTQFLGVWPI